MSRYKPRNVFTNEGGIYQEFLDDRGISKLQQFRTAQWPVLTDEMRDQFHTKPHVWSLSDNYWKLASEFYGDSKLWWVIAWFNRRPTEAHNSVGDMIKIPAPLEELLSLFNYGAR